MNLFTSVNGNIARATTRRQLVTRMAFLLGSLGVAELTGQTRNMAKRDETVPINPANQKRTSLHEEIEIKAASQRIYDALLSSKQFTAFSGLPAEIDPKVGGAFSMFGGLIVGVTVELIPNRRIVQAWRPSHWEPGVYSSARFELKPQGSQTTVILDHTGFPEGKFDSLEAGWHSHYWEPLKKFLA